MKCRICEKCAALFSLGVSEKLNHKCPMETANLIEVDVDKRKVGRFIDKDREYLQLVQLKEVVAFDNIGDLWDPNPST